MNHLICHIQITCGQRQRHWDGSWVRYQILAENVWMRLGDIITNGNEER
jgi:hypothetical protein